MTSRKTCPRCAGDMAAGFLVDSGDYGSARPTRWHPGAPERSMWTGLKLRKGEQLDVTTWRCKKCGLLESYAA